MALTTPAGPFFSHPCGDGVELVLRSLSTTVEMHELTLANLDRLRSWEQWAGLEPTLPATFETTQQRLDAFIRGAALPCAIRLDGVLVGSVDLSVDLVESTGELGCWVDSSVEGTGVARLACAAILDHAFAFGLSRIEARIASGDLRSAHVVGGVRQDIALYGIVAEDRRPLTRAASPFDVVLKAS